MLLPCFLKATTSDTALSSGLLPAARLSISEEDYTALPPSTRKKGQSIRTGWTYLRTFIHQPGISTELAWLDSWSGICSDKCIARKIKKSSKHLSDYSAIIEFLKKFSTLELNDGQMIQAMYCLCLLLLKRMFTSVFWANRLKILKKGVFWSGFCSHRKIKNNYWHYQNNQLYCSHVYSKE
jgi:hypothetical protein